PPTGGERVRDLQEILASIRDEPPVLGTVSVEDGSPVHRVWSLDAAAPAVEALHRTVLDGIPPESIRFVPDPALAARMVAEGSASVAYLLPPTTVDRIWEVVEAGRRLPPKSTSFWP